MISKQTIRTVIPKNKYLIGFLQFAGLLFLSLLLIYPPSFLQGMVFYIFQERDLSRALELLNGSLIFFGPELTGGGNLPGPFYYFLLTPPLLFGLGWMGAWYWMFVLAAAGGAFGWHFLREKFNSLTAFMWLIIFSLIKINSHLFQIFVNPSFSILFLVLINIYILKAYGDGTEEKRNNSFIIACFITGLSIQLHYSNISYIFALLSLQIFAHKLKLKPVNRTQFYQGIFAFGVTCAPYLCWLILNKFKIELGQVLPYGGSVVNAVPSLTAHFATTFDFPIMNFLLLNLKKIVIVVPPVFYVFGAIKIIFSLKKVQVQEKTDLQLKQTADLNILKVCLLYAFIPISFFFFVPQGTRYGAPFVITLSFLAVAIYHKIVNDKQRLKYFNIISIVLLTGFCSLYIFSNFEIPKNEFSKFIIVFAFINLVVLYFYLKDKCHNIGKLISFFIAGSFTLLFLVFQNGLYAEIHSDTNMPKYFQWKKIWTKINNETNWSGPEAFERIYFINHQREQSTKSAFRMFSENTRKKQKRSLKIIDGYFVSIDKPWGVDTMKWLLEQPLQVEIRSGLLSGDIVIGEHEINTKVLIAPYFVKNKNSFPAYFHNAGWGYDKLPEADLFRDISKNIGVKKITENEFAFKWNECPGNHSYCDTGVFVNIQQEADNIFKINTKIVGLSLSQSSRWISPAWTQVWNEPYFEARCGKTIIVEKLVSSIGYNTKYIGLDSSFKYPMSNNSILTPFYRTFRVKCNQSLSEISIGRKSASAEQMPKIINLPEQKLSIEIK